MNDYHQKRAYRAAKLVELWRGRADKVENEDRPERWQREMAGGEAVAYRKAAAELDEALRGRAAQAVSPAPEESTVSEEGMTCEDCGSGPTVPNQYDPDVKSCECGETAWLLRKAKE